MGRDYNTKRSSRDLDKTGHGNKAKKAKVGEPVRKCSRLKGHKSLAILEKANPLLYYDTSWWSMLQRPKYLLKVNVFVVRHFLRLSISLVMNNGMILLVVESLMFCY